MNFCEQLPINTYLLLFSYTQKQSSCLFSRMLLCLGFDKNNYDGEKLYQENISVQCHIILV